MEYSAAGVKTAARQDLPPGTYVFENDGTAIKVAEYIGDTERAYEAAADKMRALLERLAAK